MRSTMERDFKVENGVASFPMKELPDWYGIPDIGFISHGQWSDPEIEYEGKRINATTIEEIMWERFNEECEEKFTDANYDEFAAYMKDNAEDVYSYIESVIGIY